MSALSIVQAKGGEPESRGAGKRLMERMGIKDAKGVGQAYNASAQGL